MSTVRANIFLDGAGGNTATINGITPALASQAEAEAGTDNTKLMTPLRVSQSKFWGYDSGQQTLTLDGSGTLAHGLGGIPTMYEAFLVCTTANAGWAVGDEITAPRGSQIGGAHLGVTLGADATNLYFAVGSNIQIRNKGTTATFTNITAASWRLVVRARR